MLQAVNGGIHYLLHAVQGHLVGRHIGARNVIVLTIAALQVAMGKEYVADTLTSRQRRFLAGMGIYRRHFRRLAVGTAKTGCHFATTRAVGTGHDSMGVFFGGEELFGELFGEFEKLNGVKGS